MIPEAVVEAAAQGIASVNLTHRKWADLSEEIRNTFRDDARAALEAAAPHMLAGGWAQAYAAGFLAAEEGGNYDAINSNPHRSQK